MANTTVGSEDTQWMSLRFQPGYLFEMMCSSPVNAVDRMHREIDQMQERLKQMDANYYYDSWQTSILVESQGSRQDFLTELAVSGQGFVVTHLDHVGPIRLDDGLGTPGFKQLWARINSQDADKDNGS